MSLYDAFLKNITSPRIKEKFADILTFVEETYPELTPVIKWNQPIFVHEKTAIISFSTAKAHINVGPEVVALNRFEDRILKCGYKRTKMLFQIKEKDPIDYDLLKDIIDFNIEDKRGMTSFWRKDT